MTWNLSFATIVEKIQPFTSMELDKARCHGQTVCREFRSVQSGREPRTSIDGGLMNRELTSIMRIRVAK
jgi:hypothetical protein